MIRISLFAWLIIGFCGMSCTGSLTPEQREKARRAIEEGQIKRITPAELTEEALKRGKKIIEELGGKDSFFNDADLVDSIARKNGFVIYALKPGLAGLSKEEQNIAEAYQAQGDIAGSSDNVQKLGVDTILYTMPVGNERPDGSQPFTHAIAVKIPVKKLVLSIKD